MKIVQTTHVIPTLFVFAFMTGIDVLLFSFFERPCISSVLCFYIVRLLLNGGLPTIGIGLSMLCLESFIFYGYFFSALAYALPITAVGLAMRSWFYPAIAHRYILLLLALVGQVVLEVFLFGTCASIPSTIATFCANIGVMILLSLK